MQLTDRVLIYRQVPTKDEGHLEYRLIEKIDHAFECSLLVSYFATMDYVIFISVACVAFEPFSFRWLLMCRELFRCGIILCFCRMSLFFFLITLTLLFFYSEFVNTSDLCCSFHLLKCKDLRTKNFFFRGISPTLLGPAFVPFFCMLSYTPHMLFGPTVLNLTLSVHQLPAQIFFQICIISISSLAFVFFVFFWLHI